MIHLKDIEVDKRNYIRTFNTCKNNIKKTLLVINDIINNKSKTDNHFDFIIDNQIITELE